MAASLIHPSPGALDSQRPRGWRRSLAVLLAVGAMTSGLALGAGAPAAAIKVPLTFAAPTMEPAGTTGKVAPRIAGLMNTVTAGALSLPVKTLRFAIPPGQRVHSASYDGADVSLTGDAAKVAGMLPLSFRVSRPALPLAAAADLHDLASVSAELPDTEVFTQRFHGVDVAIVNVYPVRSVEGQLEFRPKGTLTVTFEADAAVAAPTLLPHQRRELEALLDYPGALKSVADRPAPAGAYDYLIVTNDSFANYTGEFGLKDLSDGLATRGLRSKVVTVAQILASRIAGADTAEKIRTFIRQEYQSSGIRFVLLAADGDEGGDESMIPARKLWSKIRAYDGNWRLIEQEIPADLYYGCLDGEFNGNGNGKWGEPTDGPGGGDVDLLCEVSVGRMPMKTTDELKNFVRKTLWAYSNQLTKKSLLAGEELFADLGLYGDDYMDQLVGQCTDHGFATKGYGTSWSMERLYDRQSSWSGDDALSKINGGGFGMVNHLGHSNTTYNLRMSSDYEAPAWANPEPFFYYTQGCFPGNFTANDSWIERLVRHERGAVAAIANTSYGLGPEDPQPDTTKTPGASQMLHRAFIDAVFSGQHATLGQAHFASKTRFIGLAKSQEIRWVFWDANFFGDPSLPIGH